ncbi:GNAT family N-acetyltransferase [Rugosimonospora acidiphila]|uniref:GNAT family N-acetyltransferase n=1 Tax=Rugosimonospora acidiphila TaxID=556531 RepID=A0ABP9SMM8_9ACTN
MLRPSDRLEHDGVRLRRWHTEDGDELLRVVSESVDHLTPWMAWAEGYDRTRTTEFLARCDTDWQDGTAYNYAILDSGGAIAGSCGLMSRVGPGGLEVGYWLHPGHTGRGMVTRAAAALTAEAFRIGADRVEIVTDAANQRSAAVARRLGFVEVARNPAEPPTSPARQGVNIVWRRTTPPA